MKDLIKIATVVISLILLSTTIISAQEHNHMNKTDKEAKHMMDTKKIDKNGDGIVYECPMKCEEASDKPGECSKCGMKLVKIDMKNHSSKNMEEHMNHKMENNSKYKNIDKNNDGIVYECPMKCEEASDKPGECSKCGMALKEVKTN